MQSHKIIWQKTTKSMAVGLGTLCLGIGSLTLQAEDWAQYRGPSHDGVSTEKILTRWPSNGLKAVWKVPTPDGFSTFVISQNKALTLVKRAVNGADREVCVALDADKGTELWATPLTIAKYDGGGDSGTPENRGGDGPRSTPSIDGDRAYVLSAALSLYCLDLKSGQALWVKDLIKLYGGEVIAWKSAASPLIDGNLIFVNGTAPGHCLMAFAKKSGELVWKGQDDKMTHATPIVATILGVRQIVFFAQSGLVSVQPEDGAVLWRYKFPYSVSTASSPVAFNDIVYCSAGYGVGGGAVRITKNGSQFTATEIWRTPNKNVNHWSTPVVHNGYLYGMFSFKDFGKGPMKCVELATGKEIWSKAGFGPGGVLLVDGNILALDDRGQLVLVEADPKGYNEKGRFQAIDGKCWNCPSLSNGRIYARSTKEGGCFDVSPKLMER
jgi:outer membrane protein assembly factor BamB